MHRCLVLALSVLLSSSAVQVARAAESGLITLSSSHGVTETVHRLEAEIGKKGLHVFAKIDHATAGKVWLAYNDPKFLAERHGIHDQEASVRAMTTTLEALAKAATAP